MIFANKSAKTKLGLKGVTSSLQSIYYSYTALEIHLRRKNYFYSDYFCAFIHPELVNDIKLFIRNISLLEGTIHSCPNFCSKPCLVKIFYETSTAFHFGLLKGFIFLGTGEFSLAYILFSLQCILRLKQH